MENVWNLVVAATTVVGCGLFGSLVAVLPGTGMFESKSSGMVFNRAVALEIEERKVESKKPKVWIDPGYEKGITGRDRDQRIARNNPANWATAEEMEMWETIAKCDKEGMSFEHTSVNCEEPEIMEEEPVLSPKVIASLDSYYDLQVDESDHHDTCVCFTCCPFGVNAYGSKISKVKANITALLSDLDTIGNPDRADAFYSQGIDWSKLKDSDLPPGFYDDDNLAQDWYDNQLYV
jgi:hypothetical protein